VESVDGHPFAAASYEREGRSRHALFAHAAEAGLVTTLARMGRLAASAPARRELVGDVFLWRPEGPGEAEANAAEARAVLAGAALPRPFRRIVIVVAGPAGMQHFTFRPAAGEATPRRPSSATRTP